MRVLVLDAAHDTRGAPGPGWADDLGLREEDDLTLMSWQRQHEGRVLAAQVALGPHRGREGRDRSAQHRVLTAATRNRHAARALRLARSTTSSLAFAARALASADARRLFAEADVVIAVDVRSQPAAWLLAQRIPGPVVLAGLPAGRAQLARRPD